MKTILVFIIQCYEHRTDKGELIDVTICELIDKNLKSAMKRAKKLVKGKKHYRLSKVIEKEAE